MTAYSTVPSATAAAGTPRIIDDRNAESLTRKLVVDNTQSIQTRTKKISELYRIPATLGSQSKVVGSQSSHPAGNQKKKKKKKKKNGT